MRNHPGGGSLKNGGLIEEGGLNESLRYVLDTIHVLNE